jgi:branched-chain amino acid transport system permease protein
MAETASAAGAVGFRNRLQDQWRALPANTRHAIVVGVQALVAILLGLLDSALGVGVALAAAIYWLPRVPRVPWRLVIEGAVVLVFAVIAAAGNTRWSLPILLAIAFAAGWIPERYRGKVLGGGVLVAIALYPFFLSRMFTLPVFGPFPDVSTGVVMLVFIQMAIGLNIVVGYAGLLDLGYVAFYATGAYTAAWFASLQFSHRTFHFGAVGITPDLPGFHISIWLLLILAGVITTVAGIVIGLPTLRLRGDYLAIVTLGFGEILPQIARNGDSLFGTGFNLTNGPNGITPIDAPGWGNRLSDLTHGFLPANYLTCCNRTLLGHQIQSADVFYWTAILLLLFTIFCSLRLQYSRLGRAWIAIREDETAAAAMGIPLMRTKTWAYATGAFFGGVAGAYYASFRSATFPGDFFFNISVFILCMVILGGMGNVWGVIVGAAFLSYLDREGLANTGSWINENLTETSFNIIAGALLVGACLYGLVVAEEKIVRIVLAVLAAVIAVAFFGLQIVHLPIDVPLYASGIYGLIILLVMLLRPEGLIPSRRRAAEFHEGVHDEPLYDTTGPLGG